MWLLHVQTLQVHRFPSQVFIVSLHLETDLSSFIFSSRVFQRRLPLNDKESNPKLLVFTLGSLHNFFILWLWGRYFFREIPIQWIDLYYLAFYKCLSLVL